MPAGTRTALVNLATGTPGEHSANDVALDNAGNAYVTDVMGAVYRVDLAGNVSTVSTDPRLGPALGANGIVWHPDGYLVVVHYTTGRLFRIARGQVTEVWTPKPLVGGDYVVDGRIDVVLSGGTATDFVLRRSP